MMRPPTLRALEAAVKICKRIQGHFAIHSIAAQAINTPDSIIFGTLFANFKSF
jgi:hypothetical protein